MPEYQQTEQSRHDATALRHYFKGGQIYDKE